jgi:rifampicin phosphotransferase
MTLGREATPATAPPAPWVVEGTPAGPPVPTSRVGGKARNLFELSSLALRLSFDVPRFLVISSDAFERWAGAVAGWPANEEAAAARRTALADFPMPPELARGLEQALDSAGLRRLVAVRSSAAAEDGSSASFAGQFESVLGVDGGDLDAVWRAIRQVWMSAFSAHALAYAARGDAGRERVRMAVVVQEMVDPAASGVAFSADPVTGRRDVAVVSAVLGIGEGLVSGELDADTFRVTAQGGATRVIERTLVVKDRAVRLTPGGTRLEPVPDAQRAAPALDDEEAVRIARAAQGIADALGSPQDIEWALTGERPSRRLLLLQTRPITTLGPDLGAAPAAAGDAAGARRVWDNSNIAESYGGVTTPLTFSFARGVYEEAYRQFCRLMGVHETLIAAHREVFGNMLGLVRGRVCYNLLNWYRTLALFPGFALNRGFMERMMGVREALRDPPEPPRAGNRLVDAVRVARVAFGMLREGGRLGREVPAFHARVEGVLGPLKGVDLATWKEDDLVRLYRRLEDELLLHWRAPLVNDFFAMIHFGLLCRLIERWVPEAPPTLANDLLCGEGGIISTEPARRVMALARHVVESPDAAAAFASVPDDAALHARIQSDPALADLRAQVAAYIERFGDRCLEELKLETETLREDPTFLIQMIRSYAALGAADPDEAWRRELKIRQDGEARVLGSLHGPRRWAFLWVLRRARARVRDRENLRFERTRVFGVVRRIVRSLGGHLHRAGRIEAPRDVFYLTLEELYSDVHGAGSTRDLRALTGLRRAEFEQFARDPAPPDRFETFGPPSATVNDVPGASPAAPTRGDLSGIGCCPGIVRGKARVVRDPREARGLAGHILVAERTDPGWTLLFPAATGLLVERGSLLSHSAIVAREMGLPCVVGVAGLLATVRDGEELEMDGTKGVIRRLEASEP